MTVSLATIVYILHVWNIIGTGCSVQHGIKGHVGDSCENKDLVYKGLVLHSVRVDKTHRNIKY